MATEEATKRHSRPWLEPYLWKKGQSGNPKGPPLGLVGMARALTREGEDLSRFMVSIYEGRSLGTKMVSRTEHQPDGTVRERKVRVRVYPTVQQRMEAASWLADRGWGKPRQTHELVSKRSTVFRQADGSPLPIPSARALPAPSVPDPASD